MAAPGQKKKTPEEEEKERRNKGLIGDLVKAKDRVSEMLNTEINRPNLEAPIAPPNTPTAEKKAGETPFDRFVRDNPGLDERDYFKHALNMGPQAIEDAYTGGHISADRVRGEGALSPEMKDKILGASEKKKAAAAVAQAMRNAPGISSQTSLPGTLQASVLNIR